MADERNTLEWPSIRQFHREVCSRINRFLTVAEAAGAKGKGKSLRSERMQAGPAPDPNPNPNPDPAPSPARPQPIPNKTVTRPTQAILPPGTAVNAGTSSARVHL